MSIASMGTGIDGLQHATDLCVFVEESFTPAENEQAVARLHRTGQKNPVRAIRITSNTTIDHVIRAANERKTTTAEGALQ
jgi:SNF2 family DNA or RNA helicase